MRTKDVIQIAKDAVRENFANYDWQEEAETAAVEIAAGNTALAKQIAKAAKKLPSFAVDDDGIPSPFLFWENLGIESSVK